MRTNKQKFVRFLESKGFKVSHGEYGKVSSGFLFATLDITPNYRITPAKDHNLISKIQVVNFEGADTKKGDLGCVTICYYGKQREFRRSESYAAELLKKVFCPKSAEGAIEIFKRWETDSWETVKGWKVIL